MAFATIDYDGSGTSDPDDTSSTDQQTWAEETPDSTTSSSSSSTSTSWDFNEDGYTFEDPDDELRDAAFGEGSETADDLGGSAILAAGGATTAAGRAISGTDTEIDPEASRHITEAAEGAVAGDDPDMDPQEAWERANAALQARVPASMIDVAGMQFHPLMLVALLAGGGATVHYLGGGN